ncbi:hypothetical protein C2L64_00885 [Paraburkholderia hospita]|uniref:Uncharacterized protein n=1 Tax=Paraburkholderia hospita TaxID=169430 RepID=A0AAN1J4Z8_9BURK|nr:hypothetical protein C2L64_00885 [Paraburkholderia hospita]
MALEHSLLAELAKSVQHPLGFAGLALALLLAVASRHWANAGTRALARLAAGAALVSLVAGLSIAFVMTRPAPTNLNPADGNKAIAPDERSSCVITGSGTTVINMGTGVAAGQVCGDVR